MTDESVYHGYADATNSDARSTYFKVNLQDYILNFYVGFWLNRQISMSCYYFIPYIPGNTSDVYDDTKGNWYHADLRFTMNLLSQKRILGDSAYKRAEVMHLVIHNQGTEPEKAFYYHLSLTKSFYS